MKNKVLTMTGVDTTAGQMSGSHIYTFYISGKQILVLKIVCKHIKGVFRIRQKEPSQLTRKILYTNEHFEKSMEN